MPFTMLDPEKEREIVETVFETLYTPYGLRTLEMADGEFHPFYEGPMEERDMACLLYTSDPYKLPGGERFLCIYIFPEGIYAG